MGIRRGRLCRGSSSGAWTRAGIVGIALCTVAMFGTGTSASGTTGAPSWEAQVIYPVQASAAAVVCPSNTECFAAGTGLLKSTNGGDSWAPTTTPEMLNFSGVACPSTAICYAVGSSETGSSESTVELIKTTDAGQDWTNITIPSISEGPYGGTNFISCNSTLDCSILANSESFIQTTNGGSAWVLESIPQGRATSLNALACPTSSTCFAAGYLGISSISSVILVTKDAGAVWETKKPDKATSTLTGVYCASAVDCIVVGSYGTTSDPDGGGAFVTTDGGSKWTADHGLPALFGVSCMNASKCVSVGYTINTTAHTTTPAILDSSDGGLKWKSKVVPAGTMTLIRVGCSTSTTCVALGTGTVSNEFVADASSNGSLAWNAETVPPPVENITGLSCWSSTDCVAVGSTENALQPPEPEGVVITTSNYGASWIVGTSPTGLSSISDVTCPSADECIAVGTGSQTSLGIDTSSDGGVTWTASTIGGDTADMNAPSGVACNTPSTCMAYGFDELLLSTDAGQTWSPATLPENIQFRDVSCPTATECIGVGQNGSSLFPAIYVTTDGGADWTSQSAPGGGGTSLFGVDCPTSVDCEAVGDTEEGTGSGFVVTTNDAGGTWTTQSAPAGVTALADVACVSSEDCTAAGRGSSDQAIIDTSDAGVDWAIDSVPPNIDDLDTDVCATSSDCLAGGSVDSYGEGGVILGDG